MELIFLNENFEPVSAPIDKYYSLEWNAKYYGSGDFTLHLSPEYISTVLMAAYIYNNDADIRTVLNQMIDGTFSGGDKEMFRELYESLLNSWGGGRPDCYFMLKDFRSYAEAQERIDKAYRDQEWWAKAAILNVAKSGKFTSDRTIQQYVDEIWHLEKITVNQ